MNIETMSLITLTNITLGFLAAIPSDYINYVAYKGDIVKFTCNARYTDWYLSDTGYNETLYKLGVIAHNVHSILVVYSVDRNDERIYACKYNSTNGIAYRLIVGDDEDEESYGAKLTLIIFISIISISIFILYIYIFIRYKMKHRLSSRII
jgi:hypothetical protein